MTDIIKIISGNIRSNHDLSITQENIIIDRICNFLVLYNSFYNLEIDDINWNEVIESCNYDIDYDSHNLLIGFKLAVMKAKYHNINVTFEQILNTTLMIWYIGQAINK